MHLFYDNFLILTCIANGCNDGGSKYIVNKMTKENIYLLSLHIVKAHKQGI